MLIDTTYFGRTFGVMVFKGNDGTNLYWKFVKYETTEGYVSGINHLIEQGIEVRAIVCDGRRGLFKSFGMYPVQMCQFHQAAIVTRYITRNPKQQASVELKELVRLLPTTDKESFLGAMVQWYAKWERYMNERASNEETGKSWYVHKRLRSAYMSLQRNKDYLFTWYDNPELGIPNTNNKLEGTFTSLKNKLRNHNGLTRKRKEKFINGFFLGI